MSYRNAREFLYNLPKKFWDFFFCFVVRKILRNISFRGISKNRNFFRLGRFEQKPEVPSESTVVCLQKELETTLVERRVKSLMRSRLSGYCITEK